MQENEYIREAAEICELGKYTPEELARYDGFWDGVRIEKTLLAAAEIEKEKGRSEERKKIIANGNKAGISVEIMAIMTGLTPEQVMKIIEELNK